MSVRDSQLFIAELQQLISEKGGIPFAEFMEQGLYHPRYGYYTSSRKRIGKQGDFFTSSSVHACFGRLLARQLEQMWQLLGKGTFTVAEQGAGEGHLCLDILDTLEEDFPEFYAAVDYRIVEISPDCRQLQAEKVARHIANGRVSWCGLAQLKGMQGCFLSNELVDAFPVHLLEMHGGALREVFVVNSQKGFAEEVRDLSTPALADYFADLQMIPGEGNRCEVNLAAKDWMQKVAEVIKKGFVITIDYGYTAADLYAPWRHGGTFLCYYQHQTNENPYERVGLQDMTAHVDFTTLENVGQRRGLKSLYFGQQYQFLLGLGFLELLLELQSKETDPQKAQALRMSLKTLIVPDGGMGDSFKVLIQGKNVGQPELICARKIKDIPIGLM